MRRTKNGIIGLVTITLVLLYALSGSNIGPFLNLHSVILVVFGTAAILMLSSPSGEIQSLFVSIRDGEKQTGDAILIQNDLLALSRNRYTTVKSGHDLIVYAQSLWEQGVDERLFRLLIKQRAVQQQNNGERTVVLLRNLSKYPPALGMTGTVIGLVSLFSGFSSENRSGIGPALALAMTATFYGLILSNAIIMPLADKIQSRQLKISNWNEQVMQTLFLIQEGHPESLIEERKYA